MITQAIAGLVERLRGRCHCNWPENPCGADEDCQLDRQAAAALEHLAGEVERLRPPHTPEGLHWLGDIGKETNGCVAYFKDEAACLAFMEWLGERDDKFRAAPGDTPAGLDRQEKPKAELVETATRSGPDRYS